MNKPWDPLSNNDGLHELISAAKKREIKNILKSYVGFFDPFCELIQNAMDAVDLRAQSEKNKDYRKKLWLQIDK